MKRVQLPSNCLKRFHTYGTLATARFIEEVTTKQELIAALSKAKKHHLKTVFLGRGSNVLFKNDNFDGMVIVNKMTGIVIEGNRVTVEGGVNVPLLARRTSKKKLSGLEYLVGVPGTVGGCVCMNAGVAGLEISKHLKEVKALTKEGQEKIYSKEECGFSYRHSNFLDNGAFVLEATFELEESDTAHLDMLDHLQKRLDTQPIKERNSGCIFKNPPLSISAGALIDQCGLKGLRVGGAVVSTKHANFINNDNEATYNDIMGLIKMVKEKVKEKKGVDLEYEVRIL